MKKSTPMLVIGVPKETVIAARQAVMEILKCKDAEEKTKRAALVTFREICNVDHTTVTDCSFTSGEQL